MSIIEVVVRLILIGSSAGVNLDGHSNVWISGSLGLVAMMATIELAVRPYGKEVFDRLLLMAGSLVVTLIILGLVLNVTPWGLTLTTWNAAWVFLSILVLFWRRRNRTHVVLPTGIFNMLSVSIAFSAAIIIAAGALAIEGVRKWDAQPILSFSLVSSSSTTVTTEINAASTRGTYRIVAFSRHDRASHYTSEPFTVTAGKGGETVQEKVPVKGGGAWVFDLKSNGDGKILRELIVDVE